MKKRTAVVFGATGLVGSYLVNELILNDAYDCIIVFSRRDIPVNNEKVTLVKNDLASVDTLADQIICDDVYCCLGTTIKKAGSQQAFEKVDLEMPVKIAEIAEKNKVKNLAVISSVGAKATSNNFYLRTKGRMENEVLKRKFEHVIILRPGMIMGPRKEFRFAEKVAKVLMPVFDPLLNGSLKKFRSVHAHDIAKAMVKLTLSPKNKAIYDSYEIKQIARLN